MTTCTVTFGLWTFTESAGADQCNCLTNQAVQELMPLCCLSDNNFVQFRCALVAYHSTYYSAINKSIKEDKACSLYWDEACPTELS